MCRTRGRFGIEGSGSGKCLTKCRVVVLVFGIPSIPLLTGELRSEREVELGREVLVVNLLLALLCWKFRDGDDPSAVPEHVLGYCGQRTGVPSLKTLGIILFPSFAFTSVLKTNCGNHLKIPAQGKAWCFQSLLLFLIRPKQPSKFVLS